MIYLVLFLALIVLGVMKKRSRLLIVLLYALLFIVSVHFTEGFDLKGYEMGYNQPFLDLDNDDLYRSALFGSFTFFLKYLGLDFYQFRIVCFLLWSIPIYYFIICYSKFPTYVVAVSSIFPLITFASQIRNGAMVSFIYVGLYFLIKFRNNSSIIVFVVLVIIAGLIHNLAFAYLVGVLAVNEKIKTNAIFLYSIIFFLFFFISLEFDILYGVVNQFFGRYYADFYFKKIDKFNLNFVPWLALLIVNIWFSAQANKIIIANGHYMDRWTRFLSTFTLRLNLILFAAFPLLLVSLAFFRIYQNVFILTVMSVANASSCINQQRGKSFRFLYILFFILLTYRYYINQGSFFVDLWPSIVL